jgi:hypothetical protein
MNSLRFYLLILALGLMFFGCSSNNDDSQQPTTKSWGTAELIETDDSGDADSPQIAMDADGNAIAVWRQSDGVRYNIWANRFDGSNWGTAELIETDDSGDADSPQIAMIADGNAIAVWRQSSDASQKSVWAKRFDGSAWGTAELISTETGNPSNGPQIAMNDNGSAIAVLFNSIVFKIWTNRFDGSAWGSAEQIQTEEGIALPNNPQVAVDADGIAIAVYGLDVAYHTNIWANRFDGSVWGASELIQTDNSGYAYHPKIAMNRNGNAIAVWYQNKEWQYHTFSYFNIWANRFDGSTWGTAELIENEQRGDGLDPQIAMDEDGNAIAVWYQSDGIINSIMANRFDFD